MLTTMAKQGRRTPLALRRVLHAGHHHEYLAWPPLQILAVKNIL